MAKQFDSLSEDLIRFIGNQKMFFVGTAGAEGRVNVSPKGMDTFRVLNSNKIIWLNLTGSGNETAAHLLENGRITTMFCSFDAKPMILRLYGHGSVIHPGDENWGAHITSFPALPGARQIVNVDLDLVQTSCGFGVPLFDFNSERDQLARWAENRGADGIRSYWRQNNQHSLDGKLTGILSES